MGLTISKTNAMIDVDRTPARQDIQTQKSELSIRQKRPMINIDSDPPRVEIDQYECFASAGLKNCYDLTKEAAEMGMQQALEYIGNKAADGDMLTEIKGGNPIADIAERDAYPVHEFNIASLPKVGPKIDVKGSLKLDPQRTAEGVLNGVDYEYKPSVVNSNFTPSKVNIYMKQYASIKISSSESKSNIDVQI